LGWTGWDGRVCCLGGTRAFVDRRQQAVEVQPENSGTDILGVSRKTVNQISHPRCSCVALRFWSPQVSVSTFFETFPQPNLYSRVPRPWHRQWHGPCSRSCFRPWSYDHRSVVPGGACLRLHAPHVYRPRDHRRYGYVVDVSLP
jgi:hypothetical protein